MPCFNPQTAYRKLGGGITFSPSKGLPFSKFQNPCGKCLGCRSTYALEWAIRITHEAKYTQNVLQKSSSFLTLTYDDEHLPPGQTLTPKHLQDFWKRYRKEIQPHKIRYFACGEYGEKTARPHYHAIVFGHEFSDQKLYTKNQAGQPIYSSELLDWLWKHGDTKIAACTIETANYVARYTLKKITGDEAEKHYQSIDFTTGEIIQRIPEFSVQSRRPGIGNEFYKTYRKDIYPSDQVIVNGQVKKPPRYYDKKFKSEFEKQYEEVQKLREINGRRHKDEKTPERLATRETCHKAKLKLLKRGL